MQAVLPTGRNLEFVAKSPNEARIEPALLQVLHQSTLTSLLKKRSEIDINFGPVGESVAAVPDEPWEVGTLKNDLTRRVRLISGLGWLQLSRMSPEKWEPSKTI